MIFSIHRFVALLLLCFAFIINSQVVYGKKPASTYLIPVTDSSVINGCSDSAAIDKIINDAIDLGAPIYNAGLHMGCYRIYETAGYKILYLYGNNCKEVEIFLKEAIDKSHGDYSDTEKAWLMRAAFDKILGEPTETGTPEKESPLKG